jgi:glutamine cyclotransferase
MKKLIGIAIILFLALGFSISYFVSINNGTTAQSSFSTSYTYSIVATYPHDQNAFTQGLVYHDGFLYESTGLYGNSTIRRVDLFSGTVLQQLPLLDEFFGEGMVIINDSIVQLTWRSQIGFIYDKASFELLGTFCYPTEGWGLTYDGEHLIMSDGTNSLYFMDSESFERKSQINVFDGNISIINLNELEFINGDIFANIWGQQRIAIIDPETGQVKSWIDLTGLQKAGEGVLNGIAYDSGNDRIFVTGKNWAQLFEIELVPLT